MFDIAYDRQAQLLRYTMRGFWTTTTITDFSVAMRKAVEPLGAPPWRLDALCDAREFPVQSGEVSELLGRMMEVGRSIRTGKTAVVVGSMMNKLQAERILDGPDMRTFLDIDEAIAWLDAS